MRNGVLLTAGNGIVIYNILQPFDNYKYNLFTEQWREFGRSEPDLFWPEAMYQVESNLVRIVMDLYSEERGIYDLNIQTLELIQKL